MTLSGLGQMIRKAPRQGRENAGLKNGSEIDRSIPSKPVALDQQRRSAPGGAWLCLGTLPAVTAGRGGGAAAATTRN